MRSKILLLYLILHFSVFKAFTQITISGPLKVTANETFKYTIDGICGNVSNVSWSLDYGSIFHDCTDDEYNGYTCDQSYAYVTLPCNAPFGKGHLTATDECGNTVTVEVDIKINTQVGGIDAAPVYGEVMYVVPDYMVSYNLPSLTFRLTPAIACNSANTLNYQWQKSDDNVVWSDISGATNGNLVNNNGISYYTQAVPGPFIKNEYYRVKITENTSITFTKAVKVITEPPLSPGEIFNTQIVKDGQPLRKITGTQPEGFSPSFSYQWQQSNDNILWEDISGATNKDYMPSFSSHRYFYRRKVTGTSMTVYTTASLYTNVIELRSNSLTSDNKPAALSVTAYQPVETPVNYSNISQTQLNYVKSYTVLKNGITNLNTVASLPKEDLVTAISYSDGLGSNLQSIQLQSTPLGNDVITQSQYDKYGRKLAIFMPFSEGQSNSNFRNNGGSSLQSFYNSKFPNDSYFYSKTYSENEYTAASLPGKAYAGSNVAASSLTRANSSGEMVWLWQTGSDGKPVLKGGSQRTYDAGELLVNESFDVYGRRALSYTDRTGRKILTKVQLNDDNNALVTGTDLVVNNRATNNTPPGYYASNSITLDNGFESGAGDNFVAEIRENVSNVNHEGWICTYYVYNDLGSITATIPPLAVKWIQDNYASIPAAADWTIDNTIFNNLCFKNTTDDKGRTIGKKTPEQDEDYIVYDKQGRPVLTQDAKQRQTNDWSYTQYDGQDRSVETGIFNSTLSLTSLRDYFGNNTTLPSTGTATAMAYTFYDNYNFTEASSKPFNATYTNALTNGYNGIVPAKSVLTTGLITGSKIKVLYPTGTSGPSWLITVSYYDNEGKVIQSQNDNIAGGLDILSNLYDFSGKVLSSHLHHQFANSVNGNIANNGITDIVKRFQYDHRGRVLKVYQKINGGTEKQLSFNEYNELGQLQKTTLGNNLESLEYTYNLQGKLTGVNSNYANGQNNTHYFGYSLGYEEGFANSRLDGNLSGILWRTVGDGGQKHAFGFNYDNTGRLTSANFSNEEGTNAWGKTASDFTVDNLKYDAHSNIQRMKVQSTVMQQKKTIDNLSYSYGANSNRLQSVSDDAGDNKQKDFVDANTLGNDYSYDVNGNLTEDKNKAVNITYDSYTDKPNKITQTLTGDFISYVYDAAGERLKKIIKQGTTTVTYTYIDGFTYRKTATSTNANPIDSLLYFSHDQGRVRRNYKNELVYDYFIKDHLGNVRMVLTEEVDLAPYVSTFEQPYDAPELEPAMFGPQRNATKEEINSTFPYYDASPNATNKWHSRLNANEANHKTGSSLILKVMAGDALDISVKAFYKSTDPVPSGGAAVNDMVQSLIGALLGSQTSVVPNGKANLVSGNNAIVNQSDIGSFINNVQNDPNNQNSNAPKAYLNYVLFNESFAAVGSGYKRVNAADVQTVYNFSGVAVPVNGYAYVWISNESGINVYFDDLSVQHHIGHIVQENTFYPYGLPIEPLSSYAAIKTANKELYQSKLLDDEMELNYYYFKARYFDPQTGRFIGVDPKMQLASGYQGMGGNPAMFVDPDGKLFGIDDILIGMAISGIIKGFQSKSHGGSFFDGFVTGAIMGGVGGAFSSLAPIGILPGLGYGAGTGALTGALSSAFSGGNVWQGSLDGAIFGGAMGAINGGLGALEKGADVWTGHRAPLEAVRNDLYLNSFKEDELAYTDETLWKFKEANFKNVKGVGNLSMKWKPKGYGVKGDYFTDLKGEEVLGVTMPRVWSHGNSGSIFFAKAAFYSPQTMFLVMGHELGHVQEILGGVLNNDNFDDVEKHLPIYSWTQKAALENKWYKFLKAFQTTHNIELGFSVPDFQLQKMVDAVPYKLINPHP